MRKPPDLIVLFSVSILTGNIAIAQITPWEAIEQMQKGINLGNTLEPPDEAEWNNPQAQEYYFDMYKEAGFTCVRVPVRWDEHTQDTLPYRIDETWMKRVEEIVGWGLERDLFIVINAHHDDWIKQNYNNAAYRARFDSIWTQISVRFKDKPEKLIFEILNEPYGLTKVQNDELHQRILSIIRKTNPARIVIFQGHNWGGSDELRTAAIPDDDYVIGSFHSYDPYLFGLEGQGTWGTANDINTLKNKFAAVSLWSVNYNIPVFLGEFGSVRSCDYNSRMQHYKYYVGFAQAYGFAYCAWDDGGNFRILERAAKRWDEVKDILLHTSDKSPAGPKLSLFQDTLVQLSWTNMVRDHDSIFIERRTETSSYKRLASLKGDTAVFLDDVPYSKIYYYYRIIIHYNSGEEIYSYPQRILVPAYVPKVREPFLGKPFTIPGTIEAEDFDIGGEGLTYHETDLVNPSTGYRPNEEVDVYEWDNDRYYINNALPGEWYEYTVDVGGDNEYKIDIYLASFEGGGTFNLKIGDAESDILTAPGLSTWLLTDSVSTIMNLTAGEQIMRFTVLSEPLFNIDKLVFTLNTSAAELSNTRNNFTVFQDQNRELVIDINEASVLCIRIYNITGALIHTIDHPGKYSRISTNGMPAGIYFIQVFTDDLVDTRKSVLY
jgi:aryl-phospho-beta-D-glucosidase BglC (GH1 family)